ncbi:MAG: recombinase family protein [Betaproteobacteria bacterium]|nr:recombinase family protein [Betaproteobacteria bacterium]
MPTRVFAYVRVSIGELDEFAQLRSIEDSGFQPERIYIDHAGHTACHRPSFDDMLMALKAGDMIVVHSLSRVARNFCDLEALVVSLTSRECSLHFVQESLAFGRTDGLPTAMTMTRQLLDALAGFERELRQERSAEAQARGRSGGRPRRLTPSQEAEIITEATQPGANKAALARKWGMHKHTLYRLLRANS